MGFNNLGIVALGAKTVSTRLCVSPPRGSDLACSVLIVRFHGDKTVADNSHLVCSPLRALVEKRDSCFFLNSKSISHFPAQGL